MWLECFTLPPPSTSSIPSANVVSTAITLPNTAKPTLHVRCPCTYCSSLNHFPDHCFLNPFCGCQHPSSSISTGSKPNSCDPSVLIAHQPQPPPECKSSIPFVGTSTMFMLTSTIMPILSCMLHLWGQCPFKMVMSPPQLLLSCTTLLWPLELKQELSFHPDKGFVGQLIVHWCHIGYHCSHFTHIAPNVPSTFTHSNVVDRSTLAWFYNTLQRCWGIKTLKSVLHLLNAAFDSQMLVNRLHFQTANRNELYRCCHITSPSSQLLATLKLHSATTCW